MVPKYESRQRNLILRSQIYCDVIELISKNDVMCSDSLNERSYASLR